MRQAETFESGKGAARRAARAALPALLLGALVLALVFVAHRYRVHPFAFSSDNLYAVALCRDILGQGYERANWHIPYAPQTFPDLALLLPCVLVCKDLLWIFLTYSWLYYGVTLAVLSALFRQAGLRGRDAFLLAGAGLLFLVAALLNPAAHGWLLTVCVPACHTGAVLAGLGLWLLVIRNLHRPMRWKAWAGFILLGGLALFSDRLVLPQFLGPICLTTAVLVAVRALPVRKLAETALLCGAAYGFAAGLFLACRWAGFVLLPLAMLDFKQIPAAFAKLSADLPRYVEGQYATVAAFFALLAVAPTAGLWQALQARRGRFAGVAADEPDQRRRVAAAALALAAGFGILGNLGGVVLSGVGRLEGTGRYLLAALFLPFLFLSVCIWLLPGRFFKCLAWAILPAVALYATYEIFLRPGTPPFVLSELCQPYPELSRTLDALARAGKIHRGLATYWDGRHVEYLTREAVPIRVVLAHGEPYLHLVNPHSWLAPDRGCLEAPRYDFLIFDAHERMFPMRREVILARFGSPREKVPCQGNEIWIYDGLVGNQFGALLRSVLAARCREQVGFTGPADPPALAKPLRNFSSMRASRRVVIGPTGTAKLTFARPMRAGLVDVAAPFDSHYEVTFHHGAEDLGTVYVPRVPVPCASYGSPGNQGRLVTVPLAARRRGWTAVTVRGAGGPGNFYLSHFLAYDIPGQRLSARQMAPGGRWRFESEDQPGAAGTDAVVADARAGEGKARLAPTGYSGLVVQGPYLLLEPGRYRVEFHVKTGPGGAAGVIGRVEVSSRCGQQVHAVRPLLGAECAGGDGYRVVGLELETDVDLYDCEFRVFAEGKAPLYVDRVELVCAR